MEQKWQSVSLATFADIFELASCALAYPDTRFAKTVSSGSFARAWAAAAGKAHGVDEDSLTSAEAMTQLATTSCHPTPALHELRTSYTNTFLNMPHPLVSPYESSWTLGEKSLLFANDTCQDAKERYRAAGMEPTALREPADHIAYELGFFALSARQPQPQSATAFWRDHLEQWVGAFCDAVITSNTPFYAPLCKSLKATCETLSKMLNNSKDYKGEDGLSLQASTCLSTATQERPKRG